jgi:RNA polymerase sigma factor (sigma-70 family)
MRRRTPYLWGEEMQELYHTGILGFHKGISAFKHHLDPCFIILVIKAYVKAEMKQTYSYKRRESGSESIPVLFEESEIARELDIFMLFQLLETSIAFSERDKEVITLRYKEDKSVDAIAKHFGVTEIAVYKNIERVVKRLKRTFDSELKRF